MRSNAHILKIWHAKKPAMQMSKKLVYAKKRSNTQIRKKKKREMQNA